MENADDASAVLFVTTHRSRELAPVNVAEHCEIVIIKDCDCVFAISHHPANICFTIAD